MKNTKVVPAPVRHLLWETFSARIEEGLPFLEAVQGSPKAMFFVDAGGARVGLRVAVTGETNSANSPLEEIEIRESWRGGCKYIEIVTNNPDLFRDFYAMGCAIVDRVQLNGQSVPEAIGETLRSWEALLRKRTLLSDELQMGLLGELLFVRHLANTFTWRIAATTWRGPEREEHDFTFSGFDIEVKTTSREERIHHITSLTQLLPKPGRPLLMLSVQVTAAAPGPKSFSLASLVSSILQDADAWASQLIREHLGTCGWDDSKARYYDKAYQLRAPFSLIPIDSRFPAVIPETLSAMSEGHLTRIRQLEYWIDVGGMGVLNNSAKFNQLLLQGFDSDE
jgi:hypothetical protein